MATTPSTSLPRPKGRELLRNGDFRIFFFLYICNCRHSRLTGGNVHGTVRSVYASKSTASIPVCVNSPACPSIILEDLHFFLIASCFGSFSSPFRSARWLLHIDCFAFAARFCSPVTCAIPTGVYFSLVVVLLSRLLHNNYFARSLVGFASCRVSNSWSISFFVVVVVVVVVVCFVFCSSCGLFLVG